ncbi:MAG: ATP-grasp domain-containing protein [Jatrophihabitantaceae bacterium]
MPALLAHLRRHRPNGLVTFSESLIPVAATLAAELGLTYHSALTAEALTSKDVQRRLLRKAGVDALRFYPIRSGKDWPAAVRDVSLPCVVKPVRGEGSRNTFRIDSAEQGSQLIGHLLAAGQGRPPRETELIAEELLLGRQSWPFGDYVSVESLVVAGEAQHVAVTGKLPLVEPFRETCSYWPSTLSAAEQAQSAELTSSALAALGVTDGVCHTELKLTPTGPRIIEVNGRLGGYVHDVLKRSCGLSMIGLAASIALGRQSLPVLADQPGQVSYIFNNLPPDNTARLLAAQASSESKACAGSPPTG